ncbi:hypothetical protein C8R45DRAFT_1149146 [Mycena sanguinolenta]|nr:hypothetical protein C8R45DRAFT_1149146 [Mycena sanguinolenta]
MRSFSSALVTFYAAVLYAGHTLALRPQAFFTSPVTDGPSGIPNVEDAVNPVRKLRVAWLPLFSTNINQDDAPSMPRPRYDSHSTTPESERLDVDNRCNSWFTEGTFSMASQAAGFPNSGADGSIIVYPEELVRNLNNGLQTIAGLLRPLIAQFNVSAGDVVHLAGTLGLVGYNASSRTKPSLFFPSSLPRLSRLACQNGLRRLAEFKLAVTGLCGLACGLALLVLGYTTYPNSFLASPVFMIVPPAFRISVVPVIDCINDDKFGPTTRESWALA